MVLPWFGGTAAAQVDCTADHSPSPAVWMVATDGLVDLVAEVEPGSTVDVEATVMLGGLSYAWVEGPFEVAGDVLTIRLSPPPGGVPRRCCLRLCDSAQGQVVGS